MLRKRSRKKYIYFLLHVLCNFVLAVSFAIKSNNFISKPESRSKNESVYSIYNFTNFSRESSTRQTENLTQNKFYGTRETTTNVQNYTSIVTSRSDDIINTTLVPILEKYKNMDYLCVRSSYNYPTNEPIAFIERELSKPGAKTVWNGAKEHFSLHSSVIFEETFYENGFHANSYYAISDYQSSEDDDYSDSDSNSLNSDMLPDGCYFENNDMISMTVICSGKDMTKVPIFIALKSVDVLVFDTTGIQILDRKAIEGLPRVFHLIFRNGVLMRVSFSELLEYQPEMTNLSLIYNNIPSLSFSDFFVEDEERNSVIEILNLRNNLITNIPESPVGETAVLLGLNTLILSGNPIGVLPGDLFYPLRNSPLKVLYLENSGLRDYGLSSHGAQSPLSFLGELEELSLSQNPHLSSDKLEGLLLPLGNGKYLAELKLNDNSYIEVPKAALEVVKDSLEKLSLVRSSLYCLDNSSFPVMPKLIELNIQHSRITQIKEGTFDSLTALEILHLDGNLLLTISHALSIPSLKVLTLDENPSGDMSFNPEFQILKGSLNNSQRLEVLSLRHVPLKKVYSYNFHKLNNLQSLKLSGSSISDIEDYSFSDQINLQKLHLRDNKLKHVTSSTFAGLKNLVFLDLSENELTFDTDSNIRHNVRNQHDSPGHLIDRLNHIRTFKESEDTGTTIKGSSIHIASFSNLNSLRGLNLRKNNINSLYSHIFENMSDLRLLDLSYNRIKEWSDPLFESNSELEILLLRFNEIETLTDAMISDFNNSDLVVALRDNPFQCSCSLSAFNNELNDTTFVGQNDYTCWNESSSIDINTYIETMEEECYRMAHPPDEELYSRNGKLYGALGLLSAITVAISLTTYRNRWYLKYLAFKLRVKVKYKNERSESGTYEYDTFICYAQADRQWIFEKLVGKLESSRSGLRVCVHERDFLVGEEITHNIIRSVEISRKVIVVISRAFVQSAWCMFELQMASNKILDERKNKLILLLLEPIPDNEQPKELKLLLKSRTYVSWVSDIEGEKLFWQRLLKAISKPTSEKEKTISESSADQFMHSSEGSLSSLSLGNADEPEEILSNEEFSAVNYTLPFSEYLERISIAENKGNQCFNAGFEHD